MKRISICLIFVAIWVAASVAVAAFPTILTPVAGVLNAPLNETIAVFLSLMLVLTIIFLALIGLEAGRSVAEHLQ